MTSQISALSGVQRPRLESIPPRVSSAGAEAIDLAESAGLILDDWQRYALDAMLGEDARGQWACFEVCLIVSRQNGKSALLEARLLAELFLFGDPKRESLTLFSAHQFKTASEHFLRVRSLIENSDHLRRQVKTVRTSHGEEGIELRNGNRAKWVARSRTSGRGFSGDLILMDEAQELTAQDLASLLPTLSARPNPQILYTGTVDAKADQFRAVRERGVSGTSPSLCFLEWSAPEDTPDADLSDIEVWRQANPALGIRIAPEFVERELEAMRNNLDAFKQERLSIWPPLAAGAFSVVTADAWKSAQDPRGVIVGAPRFAVDASPDLKSAAIVAAGSRQDSAIQVEVIEHRPGSEWVAERIAELVQRHGGSVVVSPSGPAAALLPAMVKAGVDPRLLTSMEESQACAMYLDAVNGGRVKHLPNPALDDAIQGAARKFITDRWKWSRRNTSVDISPLNAATFAHWAARAEPNRAAVLNVW